MPDLAKIDGQATGTIRENRTAGANQKMISSKQLQKQERGCFEYCCDGTVYIAKWHDNSVVTIASNWESHTPVHKVRRRVKGDVKEVLQPHLINYYDKGMGGVDLMDFLLEAYRPTIRGKKWYWPLFVNLLNTTVVAAWKIHCQIGDKKITHINFRRQVALCKVHQHREIESSVAAELPLDVRFDGVNRILGSATTQGRCKVCKKIQEVCAQNARFVSMGSVARLV